jgi:[ribosomal protein S5]-alanine N-acetyltransferase
MVNMADVYDFTEFPMLHSKRLQLRQLSHTDADKMMELFSSPEVLHFLDLEPCDSREKALGLIDWLNAGFAQKESLQWAITLRETGRWIGTCGNIGWDRENRHIEIGYNILPADWGHGYATEATHAMLRWSFENMDLHRIQADCTEGNIASERVMLKCGFKLEGIARESCWEHGRFVNIKRFGLLRREYLSTES